MGAYLSTPITEKESEDGECGRLRYGVSAMQGWRRSMEDAHLAVPSLQGDERAAIFGVFDGHGGREVAHFVARHLVEEVVRRGEWGDGAYEEALRQSFHRMDDMLRQEEYDGELKQYKAGSRHTPSSSSSSEAAATTSTAPSPPASIGAASSSTGVVEGGAAAAAAAASAKGGGGGREWSFDGP